MKSQAYEEKNHNKEKSISFYFFLGTVFFFFFPWGFISPALTGGGQFFEYRGIAYFLVLLNLLIFLFEKSEFETKKTGLAMPVILLSLGAFLSASRLSNISSFAEYSIYLCVLVGTGFLANHFSFSPWRKRIILNLIAIEALLLCIYGFYQVFVVFPALAGMNEPILKTLVEGRMTSVLSSPAAFASVLVVVYPLTFYLAYYEKNRSLKIFYLISLVAIFASLAFTASKSALIAVVLQLLLFFQFLYKNHRQHFFKLLPGLITALVSVIALFIFYFISRGYTGNTFINAFISSFSGRISLWLSAINMFFNNSLTGFGAASFKDGILLYQYDGFFSRYAHSSFLQTFAESGIAGGIGLLTLFIYLIVKCCIKEKRLITSKFIGLGITGFAFMNIFDSVIYYQLTGFLFAILLGVAFTETDVPLIRNRDFPRNAFILMLGFFLLITIAVNLAYYFNYFGNQLLAEDVSEAIKRLRIATLLNPVEAKYHRDLSRAYSFLSFERSGYKYLQVVEAKRAIFLEPYNPYLYADLASFYEIEGQLPLAIYFYKKASEVAPKHPYFSYQVGRLYYLNYDLENARKFFEKSLSLERYYRKPYVKQSYRSAGLNDPYSPYRAMSMSAYYLGNIAFQNRRNDLALNYYNQSIKIDPDFAEAYASRANVYLIYGKIEQARSDALKAVSLDPENISNLYILAVTYFESADYETAEQIVNQILKINPQEPAALKLLEDIKKEAKKK